MEREKINTVFKTFELILKVFLQKYHNLDNKIYISKTKKTSLDKAWKLNHGWYKYNELSESSISIEQTQKDRYFTNILSKFVEKYH